MKCICRFCSKIYLEHKSRADWKGYCSAKCLHAMAKKLGYRPSKNRSEYDVLKSFDKIGSVSVNDGNP